MSQINIAIDGYAGCGKSTLARDLAKSMNYVFVDTGAMYRAIALLVRHSNAAVEVGIQQVIHARPRISFSPGTNNVIIDGIDREQDIRSQEISALASTIASHQGVRDFLGELQRDLRQQKGIVMEGRDIGTVIMPEAELKLFVTASIEVRVSRRLAQMRASGVKVNREEVEENLLLRDKQDATRTIAPLALAIDAIVIDTSELSIDEQLKCCLALARPLISPAEYLPHIRL